MVHKRANVGNLGTTVATPKQTDPQFKLRFSAELRDQIAAAASANNRTMNAEILARLEESFSASNKALLEATLVAESLRKNLTQKIQHYDTILESVLRRELRVQQRERELEDELAKRAELIQQEFYERQNEMEQEHFERMKEAHDRWREADEYASFTVARERQFIETIKALTGKEPPAVEPVPSNRKRES